MMLFPSRIRRAMAYCLLIIFFATSPVRETPAAPLSDSSFPSTSLSHKINGMRFTETRPYTWQLSRSDAETVAVAVARDRAVRTVMRMLVSLPEIKMAGSIGPARPAEPGLLAVATAVTRAKILLISVSKHASTVTVTLAIDEGDAPAPIENRIRDALMQPGRLELYEEAALRESALTAEYDKLLPPEISDTAAASLRTFPGETLVAITGAVRELKALAIFTGTLPLYRGVWDTPSTALAAMREALVLAPESTLVRNVLGDVYLQTGRSQEAVEEQTRAIKTNPRFARAYHSRGMAFMALGHLSTAAADFSEATRLSPSTAAYYRDRGMLRHLSGDIGPMCEDLHRACSLGDCAKYHWASGENICP